MKKLSFFLMITISYNLFCSSLKDSGSGDNACVSSTFVLPVIPDQTRIFFPAESIFTVTRGAASCIAQNFSDTPRNIFGRLASSSAVLQQIARDASAAVVGDSRKTIPELAHQGKLVGALEQNPEAFYNKLSLELESYITELNERNKELLDKADRLQTDRQAAVQNSVAKLYAIFEGVNKSDGKVKRTNWFTLTPTLKRALKAVDLSYQQQIERIIREGMSFRYAHEELIQAIDQSEDEKGEDPAAIDESSQLFFQNLRRSIANSRSLEDLESFQETLYRLHYDLARKRSELLQQSRLG